MKKLILIVFISSSIAGFSQSENDAIEFAETILHEDLKQHLTILASDAMEGRETGKRGQKMAAAYIKYHFQSLGLQAPVDSDFGEGYYQKVPLYMSKPGDIHFSVKDDKYVNFEDIIYYGSGSTSSPVTTEVVFGGSGSDEEIGMVDYKDKSLLVVADNFRSVLGGSSKLNELREAGDIKSVFVVATSTDEDFESLKKQFSRFLSRGRLSVDKPGNGGLSGVIFISPSTAEELTGSSLEKLNSAIEDAKGGKKNAFRKIKGFDADVNISIDVQNVDTENVLGYLEGTDKKDELVIVTSHYDHIGRNGDQINNGADDDGSGTVSVLEIAEAFVKAKEEGKGPRRSILFMTVSGEEKGLLGSDYYTKNPIFPLEQTVVNLNIDMVGRIDPEHEEKEDYVYLVGSDRLSSELHELSELVNSTFTKMDLDYTYNDEDHPDRIYYRSDHWNFAKNDIPIIFYFNGTHADYHKPTDTVEKIEFDLLEKRARLVFYTAWMISNREDRIAVDQIQDQSIESK